MASGSSGWVAGCNLTGVCVCVCTHVCMYAHAVCACDGVAMPALATALRRTLHWSGGAVEQCMRVIHRVSTAVESGCCGIRLMKAALLGGGGGATALYM